MIKNDQGTKSTEGKPKPKVQGRVFALTENDVEETNTMVTGTIYLFSHDAKVLIDLGSTHSFESDSFVKYSNSTPEPLNYELSVSTPLGKSMIVKLIFKSCIIKVGKNEMLADLILLDLQDFDVILGMDWLVFHHVSMNCYSKDL